MLRWLTVVLKTIIVVKSPCIRTHHDTGCPTGEYTHPLCVKRHHENLFFFLQYSQVVTYLVDSRIVNLNVLLKHLKIQFLFYNFYAFRR